MWLNIDSAKCLFSLAFSKLFSNRMFLLLLLLLLVECLIHNSCKWFGAADFNWHVLSNKQSSLHAWLAWNVNRFGDNQFQESNCELVGWAPEWIPRTTRNKWKKTERRCRNRIKGRPLFFFWFLMIYLLFCRNILESLDVQEIDVRESERARVQVFAFCMTGEKKEYFYLGRKITRYFACVPMFGRQTHDANTNWFRSRRRSEKMYVWISCEGARAVYAKRSQVNHSLTRWKKLQTEQSTQMMIFVRLYEP